MACLQYLHWDTCRTRDLHGLSAVCTKSLILLSESYEVLDMFGEG